MKIETLKIENAEANNYSPENSEADQRCPLCGAKISEKEIFCSNCLEFSKKRDSIKVLPSIVEPQAQPQPVISETGPQPNPPTAAQSPDYSTKKNKKFLFIISTGILICLVVGSIFFFTGKRENTAVNTELNFWYSCIEKNTPAMYSTYLTEYPNGKFTEDALRKIGEWRESERLEWEKVRKTAAVDEYAGFLRAYPDSPFRNEAYIIMDSLSWKFASTENTATAYNDYLKNVESGNLLGFYEEIARERYDYRSKIKTLDKAETERVKETMTAFFRVLSRQEYKNMNRFFGKIIANFYGAKNRTAAAIISSIKADMKKNRIKSLTYTLHFDSLQTHKNNDGLFITEIPVEKKIAYSYKKRAETIDETLCVDFNPDMTIKALYEKGNE